MKMSTANSCELFLLKTITCFTLDLLFKFSFRRYPLNSRVYINLDSNEPVSCPYCGLRYIYQPIAAASKKKEEEASQ